MGRKAWWIIAVMGVLAAGLAPGLHPTQQAVGAAPMLKIAEKEYAFTPNSITATAGAKQMTITNAGILEHTFVIDELHVKSPSIKPGKSVTLSVTLKKGTYRIYCDVPGHQEAGMIATLTVK